jgi:Ran GTPase-activating protein 1
LEAICGALKDKTSLIEIDLSHNAFGSISIDPIAKFLEANRSIQILKLDNNGLGPVAGTKIAKALLASAKLSKSEGKPSNLRIVYCGRNRLQDEAQQHRLKTLQGERESLEAKLEELKLRDAENDEIKLIEKTLASRPCAEWWADAFEAHGTLVDVRMPQNGIGMKGITALARGLSKCTKLQYLDLQDNAFTAVEATIDDKTVAKNAWQDALPSWPELRVLNVASCVLSSDGEVPDILNVLATGSNPKLHTLQLQTNDLTEQTFAFLAEHISDGLSSVKLLELEEDELEVSDELEAIRQSLKRRGGKFTLIIDDEDVFAEGEAEAGVGKEVKSTTDEEADALADLLEKVQIK